MLPYRFLIKTFLVTFFLAHPQFVQGQNLCSKIFDVEVSLIERAISEAELKAPSGILSIRETVHDMSKPDSYILYSDLLEARQIDKLGRQAIGIISYIIDSNHLKTLSENPYGYYRVFNGELLSLDFIIVHQPWKGKKISQLLIGNILKRHSLVKRIHGVLDGDNVRVLYQHKEMDIKSAFKKTPAFKTLSKMGFKKLIYFREFTTPWLRRSAEFVLEI